MEKANYIKTVTKIVEELRWDLFLGHWKINIKFSKNDPPTHDNFEKNIAIVNANSIYSNAIITIYPVMEKEYKDNPDMIREVITHELVHCITEEMYNLSINRYSTPPEIQTANEKLVQHITRLIRWNHSPNKYEDKYSKKNRNNINKVSVETIQVPKSRNRDRSSSHKANFLWGLTTRTK